MGNSDFFGQILAILKDFLTELEKMNKTKKIAHDHWGHGDLYLKVSYFGHQGFENLNFEHFWTCFDNFGGLNYWIGKKKIKKSCTWPLRTWWNFFYFMTFIPKLHILATRGQTSGISTIFGHISAILQDFLTKMEKHINLHLV